MGEEMRKQKADDTRGRPRKGEGIGKRRYRRRRPVTKEMADRLVRLLCEAQTDVLELAEMEGLSFNRIAEWSNMSLTQATLLGMCRLNDVRAQLLVSRYRTLAAARLFELSKEDSGGETARKACVDLLKLTLTDEYSSSGESGSDVIHRRPISVAEMRGVLADVCRDDEADGGEVSSDIVTENMVSQDNDTDEYPDESCGVRDGSDS